MPCNVGMLTIHKGLLTAYVEYYDGSPAERIVLSNFFSGKSAREEIEIIEKIEKPCTATLSICFEFVMWAPNWIGIVDDYWMNYRINQTFRFLSE